jgi:hypothetical protein
MNKQITPQEFALAANAVSAADVTVEDVFVAVPVAVAEGDGIGPEIM